MLRFYILRSRRNKYRKFVKHGQLDASTRSFIASVKVSATIRHSSLFIHLLRYEATYQVTTELPYMTANKEESDIFSFFSNINEDVSQVTWAHGVNSKAQLETALKSDILMLEADISLGYLHGMETGDAIPIMAHPPETLSDISLQDWFGKAILSQKGIKLDFKDVKIVEPSLKILAGFNISSPLFLNADILRGPVNASASPVDAEIFLKLVQKYYPKCILSVGWTTNYDSVTSFNNFYSWSNVIEMWTTLKQHGVNQTVTFPIRASFAANSFQQLRWLTDITPNSGLTIWSAKDDNASISGLSSYLENYQSSSIYYDLHEHLRQDFATLRQSHLKMTTVNERSGKLSSFAWLLEDDDDCAYPGSEAIVLNKDCLVIYMDKYQGSMQNPIIVNGVVEFLPTDPLSTTSTISCGSHCLEEEFYLDALGIGLRSSPWVWVQIFSNGSIHYPISSGYRKDSAQYLPNGDCYRFRIIDSGFPHSIKMHVWSCLPNSGSGNFPPIGQPAVFELSTPESTDNTMQMALSSKGVGTKIVHSLEITATSGSIRVSSLESSLAMGLVTFLMNVMHIIVFLTI